MRELSIDIETYSSVNLSKSGVYAYADAPDFTILLFAYAFDDEEVKIIDTANGEKIPDNIIYELTNKKTIKTAFNANFERTCLKRFLNKEMPPEQWHCTMVHCSELGLPRSLASVAKVLGLPEQKDRAGKVCIDFFSKPCKPTKSNGGRTKNLPEHNREKWEIFKNYCVQDVVVEREIKRKLAKFPLHSKEQTLWEYDQRIIDRGVGVEVKMVQNAIKYSTLHKEKCLEQSRKLTGLSNPNSVVQLKKWIKDRTGDNLDSLNKKAVKDILQNSNDPLLRKVISLRSELSKTSTKKYEAMINGICSDNRIRGILQFYGANRTGRWAGRLVQVQNLPQNHLRDLEFARKAVCDGDYEMFEMLYDVQNTLSELIRTALIPSKGRRFIVSDFSAIEARVVAYLSQERWRMKVFEDGGDIYCASASQMFGVPVVKNGVNGHLRQKGKIAELALGYGGSVGALKSMGALEMGLKEEELQPLVETWREANPHIVSFWKKCERSAMLAIKGQPQKLECGVSFYRKSGFLFVGLPSGRNLAYVKPQIGVNKFGSPSITYMGMNRTKNTWERLETFGGKIVENIVQGFARDCLAESIIRLEDRGLQCNFHVHDEVILDVPRGVSSADEVSKIMSEPIKWAKGLVLRAESYETPFYKKD